MYLSIYSSSVIWYQ